MTSALRTPPSLNARGEISIQPSYFTSSLFVEPFRDDLSFLVQSYQLGYGHARLSPSFHPFSLFKTIWSTYGWNYLPLKILEPRGRDAYLNVVCRLFLERAVFGSTLFDRVVGIFALYTFWSSQPMDSIPPLRSIEHVPITLDSLQNLLFLPQLLFGDLEALTPYVQHVLSSMLRKRIFLVLPETSTFPENPRHLPRELFFDDKQEEPDTLSKKTGRPSKQDLARKSRTAVTSLDRWVDRNRYPLPDSLSDPAGAPLGVRELHEQQRAEEADRESKRPSTSSLKITHAILSERPMESLQAYRAAKEDLITAINSNGSGALTAASEKVVNRLQQIDAMAAERGLEVGSEGGELSGLGRVQRASQQVGNGQKGLLGLLEGSGLE